MYHAIVKNIARSNFELVNKQDFDGVLKACRFGGSHALGGVRNDIHTLRTWFERLGRLTQGLKLEVKDVWVKGWPWDTTVIIRWTSSIVDTPKHQFRFPDGTPYTNHGVHIVRMKWFKAVSIDANEDSQAVARYLQVLHDQGVEEAGADPITS